MEEPHRGAGDLLISGDFVALTLGWGLACQALINGRVFSKPADARGPAAAMSRDGLCIG